MFRNVPSTLEHRSPTDTPPTTYEDDDDDDISLVSTIPSETDPDKEYVVDDIISERRSEDTSEMEYLVKWEDYPLHRATWEPASAISDVLHEQWRETKRLREQGLQKDFTPADFDKVQRKEAEAKAARHRRRNARRKRFGLPLTEPFDSEEDTDESQAEEDRNMAYDREVGGPRSQHSGDWSRRTSLSTSRRRQSLESRVGKRKERAFSTGYQGTARKPSSALASGSGSTAPAGPAWRTAATGANKIGSRANNAPGGTQTAKKSNPVKTTAVNIFASGKIPKKRRERAMEQRLFTTAQSRRRAELASRRKEDEAPDVPPPAFIIPTISGPPDSDVDDDDNTPLRKSQPSQRGSAPIPPILPRLTIVAQGLEDRGSPDMKMETGNLRSALAGKDTTLRKKKSVRFAEDDNETMFVEQDHESGSEAMDLDTPVVSVSVSAPAPAPVKEHRDVIVKSVEKKLKFGVAPEIMATFSDVATDSDDPWFVDFSAIESIQMDYFFSASDFGKQRNFLMTSPICCGTVKSPSDTMVERVAINLRDASAGLYYPTSEYSLLIYPTDCDEWKDLEVQLALPLPVTPTNTDTELRYILLRPAMDCRPSLRSPTALASSSMVAQESNSLRDRMMKVLVNVNYEDLLPLTQVDHFFLIFPAEKSSWLAAIFNWLRACRPSCRIYSTHDEGGWSSFCTALDKIGSGTVIVHEWVIHHLHRIPGLACRLLHHRDVFWCFSEASEPRGVFSSTLVPNEWVAPGEISFTEIFPYDRTPSPKSKSESQSAISRARHVVLVTPSFLSSEPHRVWELLEWFWRTHSRDSLQRLKLVTAFDLPEYLEELTAEKLAERDKLLKDLSMPQAEITANLKGLSKIDCEHRSNACATARYLHYRRAQTMGGPFDADANEETSPLIYAPPFIDANDEQSLVNWFGWWSTARMDQYRGFHVLGSSPAMKYNNLAKGDRFIPRPKFSRVTINDPDLVRQTVVECREESVVEVEVTSPVVKQQPPTTRPKQPWTYRSRRQSLQFDYKSWFRELQAIDRIGRPSNLVKLYSYPVSLVDSDEKFYFSNSGDRVHHDYEKWWNFAFNFTKQFRAYVGLFYTIAEDLDFHNAKPDKHQAVERYPWVAVYRPAVPCTKQTYRGGKTKDTFCNEPVELIIWDPFAGERVSNEQEVQEEDLIYAQRRLIELVRDLTAQKNFGTWLGQVWYGGNPPQTPVNPPYHMDLALQWLQEMQEDPWACIPEENREEGMILRGFRKVQLKPDTFGADALMGDVHAQGADVDEDEDDTKIIFHPPRGVLRPGQSTRCINRLYETAKSWERDKKYLPKLERTDRMPFSFVPTQEWFEIQTQERRGYEHMSVAPWEEIFNRFQIKAAEPNRHAVEDVR